VTTTMDTVDEEPSTALAALRIVVDPRVPGTVEIGVDAWVPPA
jgi:hypothetical protein